MLPRQTLETLLFALERVGFDVRTHLSLRPGLGPVSEVEYRKAWRLALQRGLTARDVLTMARFFLVGSLAPHDVTLFSAPTVAEALRTLILIWPAVSGPGEHVLLRERGGAVNLEWVGSRHTLIDQLDALFSVGALLDQLRQRSARPWSPTVVRLSLASAPEATASLEQFFRCPVTLGAKSDVVVLSRQACGTKLRTASQAVARSLRPLVRRTPSLAQQVETAIAQHVRRGAAIEDVAASLGRHPRQLQRSLKAQGLGFRQLRDAALSTEARWLLAETDLSMLEVSTAVGFSDVATFTRAFSRWQRVGPAAFRAAFRAKTAGSSR